MMKQRKLIRGKFDSRFKFEFDEKRMKTSTRKVQGYFMTPMHYACYTKGGVRMIEHIRKQPWETWREFL